MSVKIINNFIRFEWIVVLEILGVESSWGRIGLLGPKMIWNGCGASNAPVRG